MKISALAVVILSFLFIQNADSQVIINEYSGANYDSDSAPGVGGFEDWIELYNTGSTAVDLSGYHLSDRMDNPTKWQLPDGVSIPANGHLLIWASGEDGYIGSALHADFKITQTSNKEAIVFSNPDGVILESDPLDTPNKRGHSWARIQDGAPEWGVAFDPTPGGNNSNVSLPYAPKPEISPKAGFFTGAVEVEVTSDDPAAIIRYTTDGSPPHAGSTLYTGPVTINNTSVFSAIAFSSDPSVPSSFVDYHTFFVDEEHSIPVVSISGDDIMTLMNGSFIEPVGRFEMFDEEGDRVAEATGEFNKHGNDSWAYDQRGIDWITRDEFGDDHSIKYKIFPTYSDRDRFQRIILKAAANDNYPNESGSAHIRDAYVHALSQRAHLELDERTYEPCILYVNGEYWGVYELREKVDDHDFTKYYYDQGKSDIDFLKTWGWTWEEYGSRQDWDILVNFVLTNDMTNAQNYEWVEERLEVLSLIDYMILHSLNVSSDWLNWNTAWWRGRDPDGGATKWRYILWDEDATFGHYINYTGVPSTSPLADPCDPEILGDPGSQGHIPMLNRLLENEDFFALYINRYADLNNDFFNCDFMIPFLDSLINRIAPEMPRQIQKWGGSMSGWEANVQGLRDFILDRCEIIDESLFDCYEDEGLSGPYELTVDVFPEETGRVKINTAIGLQYPWNATYFGGININLKALPDPGWGFTHWEVNNNVFTPDQFSEAIGMSLESNDTITAHFTDLCAGVVVSPDIFGAAAICDGQEILLTASPGYMEYLWSEDSDDESIEVSTPGVYSVTVTTHNYCEGVATITVGENTGPQPVIDGPESICGGSAVDLDAGVYASYSWSTFHNTQVINIDEAGIYQVTVTDAAGCTGVDEIQVEATNFIEPEIAGAESICTGGSSVLSIGNYSTYSWSTSEESSTITVTTSGLYSVTVTDEFGCSGEDMIAVTVDEALQPSIDGNASFCENGSTTLTVPEFFTSYNWSSLQEGASIDVTEAGIYSVTVTDDSGCTGEALITVQQTNELEPEIAGELKFCENESSVLTVAGFENYMWSTTEEVSEITVDESGIYAVTVSDANGCTGTTNVIVEELLLPLAAINGEDSFCEGGSTILNAGNFSTYEWSTGSEMATITVDAADTYAVTVTDANNCSNTATLVVQEDAAPQPDIIGPNSVCPGSNIFLSAPAGYSSYSWSTGEVTPFVNVANPGMIELTVVDFNGCEGTTSLNIQEGLPLTTEQNVTLCNGDMYQGSQYFTSTTLQSINTGSNGCDSTHNTIIEVLDEVTLSLSLESDCADVLAAVQASAEGGTNGFTYDWSNGAVGYLQNDLTPGTYTVTATDGNNCSAVSSIEVLNQTGLSVDPMASNVSCFGTTDGSIDLNILTGQPPYTITWSNGSSGTNLENLPAGDYTLLLQDAAGCSVFTVVTVGEPDPVQVQVATGPAGDNNEGTASAIASGGVAPYSYQWSNGATGFSIDDLSVGDYEVTVTDANGCTTISSFEISNSTSTDDLTNLISFDLFPNPTDGRFVIAIESQGLQLDEIVIYNVLGQKVYQNTAIGTGRQNIAVDIRSSGSGTYFVMARSGDKQIIKQLVVTQ